MLPFSAACKAGISAGGCVVAAVVVQLVWTPEPGGWLRLAQFLMVCGFAVLLLAAWLCRQRARQGEAYDAALDAELDRLSRKVSKRRQTVTSLRPVELDPPAPTLLSRPRRAWGSLGSWGIAGAVGLAVGGGTVAVVASGAAPGEPTRQVRPESPRVGLHPVVESSPQDSGSVRRPSVRRQKPSWASTAEVGESGSLVPRQRGPSDAEKPVLGEQDLTRPERRQDGRGPAVSRTGTPKPRPHTDQHHQPVPQPAPTTATPVPTPTPAPPPTVVPSPLDVEDSGSHCKIIIKQGGVAVDGCTGMEIELGARTD